MDLDTLNFLKKPEEVRVIKNSSYPYRKTHICIGRIKPNRMIKDRCAYEIVSIHESLLLEGFIVTTFMKDDQIVAINLLGEHPNCDTDTNTYCWPASKKGMTLHQISLDIMMVNFKTYYLDDCYFTPSAGLVEYKKLNSMSIQLNKGDT